MESPAGRADGLGLIAADTALTRAKTTRAVSATTSSGVRFGAYEIHLGVTRVDASAGLAPFARLDDGSLDGVRGPGVIGTYLHGALESPDVCAEVFAIEPPSDVARSSRYHQMAAWFGEHATNIGELGL